MHARTDADSLTDVSSQHRSVGPCIERDRFINEPGVDGFIRRTRELLNRELQDRGSLRPELGSTRTAGGSGGLNGTSGVTGGSLPIACIPPFHRYHHDNPSYEWWCDSLIDAAAGYRFPIRASLTHVIACRWVGHDSLRANAAVLLALQN